MLADSLFPKIDYHRSHYTKNRKLIDFGACLCHNALVTHVHQLIIFPAVIDNQGNGKYFVF
jgi:hypothetical protein